MEQTVKDSFLDLERHRRLLEENVEKLRKSLAHWQIWAAEYEGLKEELLAVSPNPTPSQLAAITRDYNGELVTKKEVDELLGVKVSRTSSQVVNLLDRRLDYVEQNIRTVQKQLDTSQNKLAAATVVSEPDIMNEEGLPIMEIVEELDEDGNVISGTVNTPGDAKPQLLKVLEKAGVSIPNGEPVNESSVLAPVSLPTSSSSKRPTAISSTSNSGASEAGNGSNKPAVATTAPSVKKSVAFTEETKEGPSGEDSRSYAARRLEEIMTRAEADSKPPSEPPIIPENEPPEESALRKQMLQYGMSEIGAVVAELDLEEGDESDWTEGDEEWDVDEDTDDEDQYGRSTGRFVDDELREKMLELERKLGLRAMENVGQNPKPDEIDVVHEGIGRITINREVPEPSKSNLKVDEAAKEKPVKAGKKSVQFAQELDIAPTKATPAPAASLEEEDTKRRIAPIGDIVERTAASSSLAATSTPQPPKRQSRFKSSLNSPSSQSAATTSQIASTPKVANGPLAHPSSKLTLTPARPAQPKPFSQPIVFQSSATDNPRIVPTGPENAILASTIVERDTPSVADVTEPDEFDPQLLNQEVAVEYHKMRNKFIGRQGGFMKEDESEIIPLSEEEGGRKKVSRFKAARLGL